MVFFASDAPPFTHAVREINLLTGQSVIAEFTRKAGPTVEARFAHRVVDVRAFWRVREVLALITNLH